jgi:two-component system sensor histidine kinase ArlS
MKVRYKITAAFVLLTVTVLATLCLLIYLITADQHKRDFNQRLRNRALTVSALLSRLPTNGYEILSRLDSSTTNLLVSENILVYGEDNQLLYRFDRDIADSITVDNEFLQETRSQQESRVQTGQKRMLAAYYPQAATPIVVITAARDDNGRQNLRDLRVSLVIAFFAGIGLAFVTGWIFSQQLLRPLEKIADKVNTISANNIEARLPEEKVNDEWNKLSFTFNKLLARIQDSFELQGRFISNASHELSTPLTIIINQIDVALQKARGSEEYLRVLRSVHAEVQHMAELTQHLLTLARTARGGAIRTEAVRIDELLMDIPSLMKDFSPDYTVQVHFDELPDEERQSTVEGNRDLLLSACRNISENGCKYSPDHTVQVSLSFVSGKIIILFSNLYTFFDASELDTIFQPFQRGSNVSAEPGYGLGLSLTRRIILLHGGEIKAEIARPGKMLITVILPSSL